MGLRPLEGDVEGEQRLEQIQTATIKRMERQLHRWSTTGADRGFRAWQSFVVSTRMEEKQRDSLIGKACRRFKNLRLSLALSWWRHVVIETDRIAAAQESAMKLMERTVRRMVRESIGPSFEWWVHVVDYAKRVEEAHSSAGLSLIHISEPTRPY